MGTKNAGSEQINDEEEDFEGIDLDGDDVDEEDGQEDEGEADEDQGQERRQKDEDGEVLARQQARQTRGNARIQALINANKEANERAKRAEELVQQHLARQQQQQDRPDPRAEQERLALMTPEERIEYRFTQSQEQHQRELRQIQANMADQMDRTQYATKAASSPVYRKYENEVELAHQNLKSQGQYVSREAILKFKLGEKVLERQLKAAPKQRQRAQENIRRQQTRPGQTRQDVQVDRRRSGDTPASRLDGVQI